MYNRYERRLSGLAIAVRIAYMIPAAIVYLMVNLWRRIVRWYLGSRAESWTTTDARVHNSYEIDENESVLSLNAWDDDSPIESDFETDDDDYRARLAAYHARFAVAIEYTYRVAGEVYTGAYFLPETYTDGSLAGDAQRSWAERKIVVRYNPSNPAQSVFLVKDGAPGKPHIPRALSSRPYVTNLSLK
jgi:hypothetical protein